MDGIDQIITAIVCGASTIASGFGEKAVTDLYDGLKSIIKNKYRDVSLEQIEKKPESEAKQASLREDLLDINASVDVDLLNQSQQLLSAISQINESVAQAIGINLESVKAANIRLQEILVTGEQAVGVSIKNAELSGDIEISKIKVEANNSAKK